MAGSGTNVNPIGTVDVGRLAGLITPVCTELEGMSEGDKAAGLVAKLEIGIVLKAPYRELEEAVGPPLMGLITTLAPGAKVNVP